MEGPLAPGRLVIPAGRTVHVHVTSEDVIHSFWVPRLAGKIDAIPGHVNVIRLVAPAPGVYHARWDLTNSRGEAVASGVYLFMVKVKGGPDGQSAKVVKKLAVVK